MIKKPIPISIKSANIMIANIFAIGSNCSRKFENRLKASEYNSNKFIPAKWYVSMPIITPAITIAMAITVVEDKNFLRYLCDFFTIFTPHVLPI